MATVKAYKVTKKGYRSRSIRLDAEGVKKYKKRGWKVTLDSFGVKPTKASSDSDE